MAHPTAQPALPVARTLGLMVGVSVGLGVLACWAVPAIFGHPAGGERAAAAATATVVWSAVLGLAPVLMLERLGMVAAVWGYFLGAGFRVLSCLAATVAAFTLTTWHPGVWVVTLMGLYLPTLMLEVGLLARRFGGAAQPEVRA